MISEFGGPTAPGSQNWQGLAGSHFESGKALNKTISAALEVVRNGDVAADVRWKYGRVGGGVGVCGGGVGDVMKQLVCDVGAAV